MLIPALQVATTYFLLNILYQTFGAWHLNRPICVGLLIGLALGDIRTGVILGAAFETLFLGVVALGGTQPMDACVGSTIGISICMLSDVDPNTAMAIAIPIAILAMIVQQFAFGLVATQYIPPIIKKAEAGDDKGMTKIHWVMSIMNFACHTVVIFIAVYLGANAIEGFMASLPEFVARGFTAAGRMLPAVGFAMLLNVLYNKKTFAFFFVGFILFTYLAMPSIAIAVLAVVIGVTMFYQSMDNEASASKTVVDTDEKEGFFNE